MSDTATLEPPVQAGATPSPALVPDGVFLIHGLGGTQYDLGSMHKRLKNAGFVTHSLTLPGHGTTPEDRIAPCTRRSRSHSVSVARSRTQPRSTAHSSP
jgi:carboxylesterase